MIKISREIKIYNHLKIFNVAEICLTWGKIAEISISRDWGDGYGYYAKDFYIFRLGKIEIGRPRKNDDIPF